MNRYEKADIALRKVSYKGLTADQKKYVKAVERHRLMDKQLTSFYRKCRRTVYGAVDFVNMTDEELDLFEYLNKENERALKTMSQLEGKIDVNYTLSVFRQINTHSASF